jgi:choline dehydrogenase
MRPDLIIVGAGSSGAVIARRVSENADLRVLVLEAGPDYPDSALLPPDLADGSRNSMRSHDWGYRHRPTRRNAIFPFPRGRVVGGSSAVNTCIALRGQPCDYDEWAERGLSEWSWAECLPAFKRLERDLDVDDEWHGRDGPLPVRRHPPEEWAPWQAAFVEACRELGFPDCYDSNRPGAHGVGPHAMNKVGGRRISVAEANLTPEVRRRDNFALRPDTLVRRVLFRGRTAIGVEVEGQSGVETLHADRVVLCAGAINTPGMLLRSGIGPRGEVERIGCDEVADLPAVGRLLDHPGTAIFLRPRWFAPMSFRYPLIQTVLRYPTREGGHPADMLLQPGSRLTLPRLDVPLVSLMCSVGKPRGQGRMHWRSASPRELPRIDSQLLADPHDLALAADAMQLAYRLAQTRPMSELAAHFWPSARLLRSRARVEDWIFGACDSGYHPCGTVAMGAAGDPSAAADGRGRVFGVENLYVADASLLPTIPSSNIHLPVLMVAERIGAWLRDGVA